MDEIQGMWEEGSFHTLSRLSTSQHLQVFTNPETLNPIIWILMEGLLHRYD